MWPGSTRPPTPPHPSRATAAKEPPPAATAHHPNPNATKCPNNSATQRMPLEQTQPVWPGSTRPSTPPHPSQAPPANTPPAATAHHPNPNATKCPNNSSKQNNATQANTFRVAGLDPAIHAAPPKPSPSSQAPPGSNHSTPKPKRPGHPRRPTRAEPSPSSNPPAATTHHPNPNATKCQNNSAKVKECHHAADAQTQLRMLQSRFAQRRPTSPHLQVRMHLLRRMCRSTASKHLPQLRRQPRPPPHKARHPPRPLPAFDRPRHQTPSGLPRRYPQPPRYSPPNISITHLNHPSKSPLPLAGEGWVRVAPPPNKPHPLKEPLYPPPSRHLPPQTPLPPPPHLC